MDLIYADPPYCTGKDWGAFDDRWDSFDQYLEFMEKRLRECHRILAKTGSLYLHVEPQISHYLKVLMDNIFGKENFRREIVWNLKAGSGFKSLAKNFVRGHDIIFYYCKYYTHCRFNKIYRDYDDKYLQNFRHADENGRRFRKLTGGRRQYLDTAKGIAITDVWDDILSFQCQSESKNRLGYPTEKPLPLLARIIKSSTKVGDTVLDPFCGSGTTLQAAELLWRRWIGIDIGDEAIQTSLKRMGAR